MLPLDMVEAPAILPRHLVPMQPRLGAGAFNSADYLFEVKWDGVRAFVGKGERGLWVVDRHGEDLLARLPELQSVGAQLPSGVLIDAELVVCDARGRPRYELLAARLGPHAARRGHGPILLGFDLLYERHRPLLARPLVERRERLARALLSAGGRLIVPEHLESDGEPFFDAVRELELEGIVAKRRDSTYVPGARTADWLKVHVKPRLDVVLCGAVIDEGLPKAVLCGAYRAASLVSVGAAYVPPYLRDYLAARLEGREVPASPIDGPVDVPNGTRWLRAELCAIVEHDGASRAALGQGARFRSLRLDAHPADCRIEEPIAVSSELPRLESERPRLVVLRSLFHG